MAKTRPRKRREMTARERVLARWPNAEIYDFITLVGCAVYAGPPTDKQLSDIKGTAHKAWADAASRLGRKP